MVLHDHILRITGLSEVHEKISAARALAPFTDDSQVMDALCETAVNTTSNRLRNVILGVLKSNPAGACMRFSDYALWSPIPSCRQGALANLSLLACRDAKAAVIRGLSDPDASVRKAAAMNAGLYEDGDVLNALERYFESHRFDLTIDFAKKGLDELMKSTDSPDDEDFSGRSAGVTVSHLLTAG